MIPLARGTEALASNLTPSDYAITGYFKGMVSVKGQVQVVAGETSEVQLTLQPGARLRCEVWWPKGEVKTTTRKYRILASGGKLFHEYESPLSTMSTQPYPLVYTLPPGRWKVEFSTDDGLAGEVEFVVKNASGEIKQRIDLK